MKRCALDSGIAAHSISAASILDAWQEALVRRDVRRQRLCLLSMAIRRAVYTERSECTERSVQAKEVYSEIQ